MIDLHEWLAKIPCSLPKPVQLLNEQLVFGCLQCWILRKDALGFSSGFFEGLDIAQAGQA
jgi:hypothetical protein